MPCGKPCNCPTYRDHVASINFAASAMPTRKPETAATVAREKRWARDMPAYKSLAADGLQPRSIDGAGDIQARATVAAEVETGHISAEPKLYQEAFEDLSA